MPVVRKEGDGCGMAAAVMLGGVVLLLVAFGLDLGFSSLQCVDSPSGGGCAISAILDHGVLYLGSVGLFALLAIAVSGDT